MPWREQLLEKDVEGLEMKAAVIGSSLRGEVGLDVIQRLKEKKVFTGRGYAGVCASPTGQKPGL